MDKREAEQLFLRIHINAENTENQRCEAYYTAVSPDGGETWEMANPYEALVFQLKIKIFHGATGDILSSCTMQIRAEGPQNEPSALVLC